VRLWNLNTGALLRTISNSNFKKAASVLAHGGVTSDAFRRQVAGTI